MNITLGELHWRDSARYPKFFWIDARSSFVVLLTLLYIKLWTVLLMCLVMAFLSILNHYGFTVPVFGRWLRSLCAGRRKAAILWWM